MPEGPAPPIEPAGETSPPLTAQDVVVGRTYQIRSGEIVAGPHTRVTPGMMFRVLSRDGSFVTVEVPSLDLHTMFSTQQPILLVEIKGGRRRRTRKTKRRLTRRRK